MSARERPMRYLAAQQARGLRRVVLWLYPGPFGTWVSSWFRARRHTNPGRGIPRLLRSRGIPDVDDAAFRARLKEECGILADLTPDEDAMAAGFETLAPDTDGWR